MATHTRSIPSRLSIVEAIQLDTLTAGQVQIITTATSASTPSPPPSATAPTCTTHTTPPTSPLPARPANVYHHMPAHPAPELVPDTVQHPTLNTRSLKSDSLSPTSQSPNTHPGSPSHNAIALYLPTFQSPNIQHSSSTHPYNIPTTLSGPLSPPSYSTAHIRRNQLLSDARALKFVFRAVMFGMAVAGLWMQIVSLRPKVSPN